MNFRIPPVAWAAITALVALAVPTAKFGGPFLRQFFISPFQFFILPLWLVAWYSHRTGKMPTRSGPPILREENPAAFRQNLAFTIVMGAVMFVFNLVISWLVMARR